MLKKAILIVILGFVTSCKENTFDTNNSEDISNSNKDYTQFVNPFIGTSKMGHTFPGATAPFGMVQLSPQTNFKVMFNEDGS